MPSEHQLDGVTGIPDGVTRDDVLAAISDLEQGGTSHRFRDSTGYDLLYRGKRFPPKAVLGIAARRITGRILEPNEFSGGEDSKCFAVIRGLDFEIVPKVSRGNVPELPASPTGSIWLENTKSVQHGGAGWEFGTCLWSPSKASDGRDWYNTMREPHKGDLVLHSMDATLTGFSYVRAQYREVQQEPPEPGQWAGMAPYYRIDLEGYQSFPQQITLSEIRIRFENDIREEIQSTKPTRYPFALEASGKINQSQNYINRCTKRLFGLIRSQLGISGDADSGNATPTYPDPVRPVQLRRTPPHFWAISLGEGGRLWNKCQEEGICAIGWDDVGDLRQFADQAAIFNALSGQRGPNTPAPHNDSRACFEFVHKMHKGDYVVAKIGRSKLLGVGTIESDYNYDPTRSEYHHIRRVKWLRAVNLELPEDAWVPTKTLTDATDYQAFVSFVTENLLELPDPPAKTVEAPPFTIADALSGLFMPKSEFESIIAATRHKKNVILQGAPGVGKTFVARRIAYAILEQKDTSRVGMVQFHQSYAYEDFVQGYRPKEGGGFHRRDGLFYDFCNRARTDLGRPYVFIIDEINRGNLSKVFGELMMLIESDKRGSEYAIPLTYADVQDPQGWRALWVE
ncbi:MAG: AAA family ATPase [Planctomycetaceae bacterium]|nr:AAA family ATPase [Planctomycetaceae bacterium]